MPPIDVTPESVQNAYITLNTDAEDKGYHLNPDAEFTKNLVTGLLKNEKRYGYRACPCRLASGKRNEDLDIICPCDYRDSDLEEFGSCYCALYVTEAILSGGKKPGAIPERRPPRSERVKGAGQTSGAAAGPALSAGLSFPVWRCRVCGYLCARNEPPGLCPVCKATRDRFERFI